MFAEFKKLQKNQCRKKAKKAPHKKPTILKNSSERNFAQQIKVHQEKNNLSFSEHQKTQTKQTLLELEKTPRH